MPQTPHVEKHFTSSEKTRDIVIGMAGGLTVPCALVAGLSGVRGLDRARGRGRSGRGRGRGDRDGSRGYLAAWTDAEHYDSEYAREHRGRVTHPSPSRASRWGWSTASRTTSKRVQRDALELGRDRLALGHEESRRPLLGDGENDQAEP